MEKPIDGFETSSEIGKRVIDQPELPAQGLATDSEVCLLYTSPSPRD